MRYDPIFIITKDFDLSSFWQVRAVFVRQAGHTLIRADRESKREALSTHPSPQGGEKRACFNTSAPGHHYQPEGDSGRHYQQAGYPDAHFSPKEGACSDDNPSQTGG